MAKLYETVVIVDAMIPEEAIESEFDAIEDRIVSKGKLIKIDKWGKRKLAYLIKGRSHGDYAVFYYESEGSFSTELEKGFRINENILRWLTVADNPAGVPEDKPVEKEKDIEKKNDKAAEVEKQKPEKAEVEKQKPEKAEENKPEETEKEKEENVQAVESKK